MLGHHLRDPQLTIDAAHQGKEAASCHGIQLTRGLVQHEHRRFQGHHGRQVQQLLLAARQRRCGPVQPFLHAEEVGGLSHPQTHGISVAADILQPEGQLGQNGIADDLVVGVLQHEADGPRLLAQGQRVNLGAVHQHSPAPLPRRRQRQLQLAQQRGLAAARQASQHDVLPRVHDQAHIAQRRRRGSRRGEGQMFESEQRHRTSPPRFRAAGNSRNAPYATRTPTVRGDGATPAAKASAGA